MRGSGFLAWSACFVNLFVFDDYPGFFFQIQTNNLDGSSELGGIIGAEVSNSILMPISFLIIF